MRSLQAAVSVAGEAAGEKCRRPAAKPPQQTGFIRGHCDRDGHSRSALPATTMSYH